MSHLRYFAASAVYNIVANQTGFSMSLDSASNMAVNVANVRQQLTVLGNSGGSHKDQAEK
jgi:hypothetical protein